MMLMTFLCYLKAAFTEPGNALHERDPVRDELSRCHMCNIYVPRRARHCYSCNKCVLRMDHHCPIINNCIGYYNFKPLFLMCLYGMICGLYYIVTEIYIIFFFRSPRKIFSRPMYGIYLFTGLMYSSFTSFTTLFAVQYFLQVIHGITTFERLNYANRLEPTASCQWKDIKIKHRYNLGFIANFERMFSRKILMALLPITDNKDYGYDFKSIPEYCPQKVYKDESTYLEEAKEKYKNIQLDYEDIAEINK